ncbi:MAG: glutamine--tRNA ligase/YqeY domain fusion protein [candidate division Zixibacteria bacterium]|nr:glutamine--tRNA ligase/YqeY domain fusion protein [candidate division Zixibacteria bacterium]
MSDTGTDSTKEISEEAHERSDFIREIIKEHNASGRFDGRVHTRFPPEPNGYLHIGHAKSICLNFGIAADFGGKTNLRFDDTNPLKEEREYIEAIKRDVVWLGFDWEDRLYHASEYFDQFYDFAVQLITDGKAYVDDLSAEEIRQYRGTLKAPGKESPHRNRSVEDNLDLFERMRNGEFGDGEKVLRAKIDMASGNINMRDPTIYRIKHAPHPHIGDKWCIYPMYDFAHCLSDSLERITHSICTLEFEDHRPLYDWYLDQLGVFHSQQIEFARLELNYTIMSKRKLLALVKEGSVSGWDDPRMPTIMGLRRRGFTPESIRDFCDRIGVAKRMDSVVDIALLEHCLREDLNKRAPRVMAVLNPVKLVIDNYPEGQVEEFDADNNPEDDSAGTRKIPFTREVYIERDDFMEDPPKKFFRLAPGREVRLKHAYYVTCTDVVQDDAGEIVELHCTYDPESRGGGTPDGRRVKGTLQWVSVPHAVDAEVRLFDRLFNKPDPEEKGEDFRANLNPESLVTMTHCKVEPSLANAEPESRYQFLRHGYFCADMRDTKPGQPVFNRTVSLRDTWAKMQKK